MSSEKALCEEKVRVLEEQLKGLGGKVEALGEQKEDLQTEIEKASKENKEQAERTSEMRKILVKCRNTIEGGVCVVVHAFVALSL